MANTNINQVTPAAPKFNTHKVFAAIGIILTAAIIITAAVWYFTDGRFTGEVEDHPVKDSTSQAKPATNSATKSATTSTK